MSYVTKFGLLAGVSVALAVLAPFASAQAETYAAQAVDVVDAAAIVHVIAEARTDVSVTVARTDRLPAPRVSVQDGRVIINGGLAHRIRGCGAGMFSNERGARVNGVGVVREADLPVITIRAPAALDFRSDGAVYAEIGAVQSGRVRVNGCGSADIASARGALDVDSGGSGSVRVGAVGGLLNARLRGSGGVDAVSAAGATLSLSGSGGLNVAQVTGPLDARLSGSGALRVGAVRSETAALDLSGSGGIHVREGQVGHLATRLSGSGGIRFGGRAAVLNAHASGSGGISVAVADTVESLRDTGSGGVHIGNQ